MVKALDSLYKDIILEHNKEPRNFGEMPNPDLKREGFNPLCGDRIVLNLKLNKNENTIEECRFRGEGCSICMASSSIMTEEVTGKTVEQAKACVAHFRGLMQGKVNPKEIEGDIEALSGVREFPVRIKCALLGWVTLNDALEDSEEESTTESA